MSVKRPCVNFRTGNSRPSWAVPIASGLFAGLEIADRERMRRDRQPGRSPRLVAGDATESRVVSRKLRRRWASIG